jgi:anti-sigma factor ChrR (cupin superfamily)
MTRDELDLKLFDYVLGALSDEEKRALEAEPGFAAALAEVEDLIASAAWSQSSAKPEPAVRERLLASIAAQPAAKSGLAQQIARFFDIAVEQARRLLEKASSESAWEKSALPGMYLFHLTPGPRWAGADAGLVRFDPNVQFPMHVHVGGEHTLMLEGGITLDDGRNFVAGEEMHLEAGTQHAFTVLPAGCFYALVIFQGIDIPGIGRYTAKGLEPA